MCTLTDSRNVQKSQQKSYYLTEFDTFGSQYKPTTNLLSPNQRLSENGREHCTLNEFYKKQDNIDQNLSYKPDLGFNVKSNSK